MGMRPEDQQQPNLLQMLLNPTPRQKAIAGVLLGLGGAAGLVAAFRNEKFRGLMKDAGDATKDFAEETGKDVWQVLKDEIPGLGERAAQRFGEGVANPFAEGLANELKDQNPAENAIGELFRIIGRMRRDHPIGQRVRIIPDQPTSDK